MGTRSTGGQDPAAVSVAAYSDVAEDYAAEHECKMLDRVERFADMLPPGAQVLDAGCGPGRDLARFVARGLVARGVDLNPVFVELAGVHAPTSRGDLREVASAFAAGSFDGIWACASLVHLTESEAVAVLGQLAGLLRPGGKLYACVKAVGRTGWLDEPDGCRRWYTVWDSDAFADAMSRAGFAVDEVVRGVFVEVWATGGG